MQSSTKMCRRTQRAVQAARPAEEISIKIGVTVINVRNYNKKASSAGVHHYSYNKENHQGQGEQRCRRTLPSGISEATDEEEHIAGVQWKVARRPRLHQEQRGTRIAGVHDSIEIKIFKASSTSSSMAAKGSSSARMHQSVKRLQRRGKYNGAAERSTWKELAGKQHNKLEQGRTVQ